jgi:hypothetical protein
MEVAKYRPYVKLRTFLSQIIVDFPKNYIKQFFDFFINSEYRISRNKAYDVSESIWNLEIEEKLWEKWSKYKDPNCLLVLAKQGKFSLLLNLFKDLWKSDDISFKIKNILLKRVASLDFQAVTFLKNDYPISYLYAAALNEKPLEKNEAINLALKAKDEEEFRFALWCLGKTKSWEALLELNSKLELIQEKYRILKEKEIGLI